MFTVMQYICNGPKQGQFWKGLNAENAVRTFVKTLLNYEIWMNYSGKKNFILEL